MEGVEQQQDSRYNVLSIVGFILAFIIPPIGFILGIVALVHINKTGEKGKGLAIAAIVLGALFFLIFIFMVIIGMTWFVVKNTVQEGFNQVNINSMCLEANVRATAITNSTPELFDVTLTRQSGEEELGGVKVVLQNDDGSETYVADVPGDIKSLMSKAASVTLPAGTIANPSKASVVAYFMDDSGNAQLCSVANQFKF